jgi:hypothetical protein
MSYVDTLRNHGGSSRDSADDQLKRLILEYPARLSQIKGMTVDELVNYHAVWYSVMTQDSRKREIYDSLCLAAIVELKKRLKKPRKKQLSTKSNTGLLAD